MRFRPFSLLQLILLLALAPVASATTWFVNGVSGNDSNDCLFATTACKTIGHAISLAASGDTIKVAAATYTENLTIGVNLRILGSGANVTILNGGGVRNVVVIGTSAHVNISAVTITKGQWGAGAGIFNWGALTLSASTVSGNVAHLSCLRTSHCNPSGGGIANVGTLTISKSTVSGNRTYASGCDVGYCFGEGGGIDNSGTLTLNNSTVSGNGSEHGILRGGGIYNSNVATISNSTIAGNGGLGGIFAAAAATLKNSIVANNNTYNCRGTISSLGYNLSSDTSCNFSGPGELNNINPQLEPLQYNGGPTQTMALPSGSPAIDAGNPTGCTDNLGHLLKTDQRGKPRPDVEEVSGCDLGSYEYQSLAGHCVIVCGTVGPCRLTGYCAGSVNNSCQRGYDPVHCLGGQSSVGSGFSCGQSIDPERYCKTQ